MTKLPITWPPGIPIWSESLIVCSTASGPDEVGSLPFSGNCCEATLSDPTGQAIQFSFEVAHFAAPRSWISFDSGASPS